MQLYTKADDKTVADQSKPGDGIFLGCYWVPYSDTIITRFWFEAALDYKVQRPQRSLIAQPSLEVIWIKILSDLTVCMS